MNAALVLLTLIFFICAPTFAVEFYVAVDGTDDNSGTKSRPFATLKRAWMGASGGGEGRVVIETRSLTIAGKIQHPGKIEESSQLTAAGGQNGYYAIGAINNGQPGTDGSQFFSQIE